MHQSTRSIHLHVRKTSNGLLDASLTSELPVSKAFGQEVLICTPEAVDLSRAADGLPLLWNHDGNQLIGRIYNVRVADRRVRGTLTFFDTALGNEVRTAVESGHREMSIAYSYGSEDFELANGVYYIKRWTLLEGSVVSIPADPTVGVTRAQPKGNQFMKTNITTPSAADDLGDHDQVLTRSQRRQSASDAESKRLESLTRIAESYSQYISVGALAKAVRDGTSVADFQSLALDSMQSGATDVRGFPALVSQVGDRPNIEERFSISRAIQAQIDPASYLRSAGFEAEISKELQRNAGVAVNGLLVPMGSFFRTGKRDMTAGVGGAGSTTVPTLIDPSWIDFLRARSVVAAMGAMVLPGLTSPVSIPRQNVASVVGWLPEIQSASETQPDFTSVTLSPKRVGAFVDPSKQLLITSGIDIEHMVLGDLRASVLAELDRVALVGQAGASMPIGIKNTGGIGTVVGGTNGASLTWQHICDLEKSVDAANGMINLHSCGYAINPSTRSYCKRTPRHATLAEGLIMGDAPNDQLGRNVLNGYPTVISPKLPNNLTKGTSTDCSLLIFGDWTQLMLGFFGGGVELIVDPYTLAVQGQIRIIVNMFCDVGIRQPGSFATMEDARLP
ncbi:MAG: phage major capsid protein [Burkholderiaceae bacterium]